MRYSEEEALEDCHKVLRKIRQAINRQRTINMDVQNGVSELEELFDIIKNYRRNWKTAEEEKEASRVTLEKLEKTNKGNYTKGPSTSQGKRSASSPADLNPGKKPKGKSSQNARALPSNRGNEGPRIEETPRIPNKEAAGRKRPRKLRERLEAVIIRPTEGYSYAEVLRNLRSKVKPNETEVAVRSIRKTKTGAILLEMGKGGKKDEFRNAIKGALKEVAEVKELKPMATLEIRDLDALSTKEEIVAAINTVANTSKEDVTVRLTDPNNREQRRAFVSLPVSSANELLRTERIKIAWTNCRIRYREEIKRCFRCFGVGHMQWECEGPDRKGMGLCIRCGEKGHKLKECKNLLECCICLQDAQNRVDHLPGSRDYKTSNQRAR